MSGKGNETVPSAEWIQLKPLFDRPVDHRPRAYVRVFMRRAIFTFVIGVIFMVFALIASFASLVNDPLWLIHYWHAAKGPEKRALIRFFVAPVVLFVPAFAVLRGLAGVFEERILRKMSAVPLPDTSYKVLWSRQRDECLHGEVHRNVDSQVIGVCDASSYKEALREARAVCWRDAKERKVFFSGELPDVVTPGRQDA